MHEKNQTDYGRGNLTFEIDLSSEFDFREETAAKNAGSTPLKGDVTPPPRNYSMYSVNSRRGTSPGLGRPTFEYEGETLKGKAHGFGTARGVTEDLTFEGSWIEGVPEGFCTKTW